MNTRTSPFTDEPLYVALKEWSTCAVDTLDNCVVYADNHDTTAANIKGLSLHSGADLFIKPYCLLGTTVTLKNLETLIVYANSASTTPITIPLADTFLNLDDTNCPVVVTLTKQNDGALPAAKAAVISISGATVASNFIVTQSAYTGSFNAKLTATYANG